MPTAQRRETVDYRAQLYHALAESLGPPPSWMARAGGGWPLTEAVQALAARSDAARESLWHLRQIPAESLPARQARYQALFSGAGRPRLWLYESMSRSGKLLGPETLAVQWLYQVCGLRTVGAELPDHASMELAFLSYLAEQQERDRERRGKWHQLEQQFARKHAGAWLPQLGQALAAEGDPVYGPIGRLLAAWLTEILHPGPARGAASRAARPRMVEPAGCTLCGFCAQVCPTQALAIQESETDTRLLLNGAACVGCRKCAGICGSGALAMDGRSDGDKEEEGAWVALRHSPRLSCPGCGAATVSRAEMDFVAARIGDAAWLAQCQPCRLAMMENN